MTVPVLGGKTAEPAVIGGAVVAVFNAVVSLLVILGVTVPAGAGGAVQTVVMAIAGALATILPVVAGFVVRGKVTPVKDITATTQVGGSSPLR